MPAPPEGRNNLIERWDTRVPPVCKETRSHLFQVYSTSPKQRGLHPVWSMLGDFLQAPGQTQLCLNPLCSTSTELQTPFFRTQTLLNEIAKWLNPSTALCLLQCHTLQWAPDSHFGQSWWPGPENEEKTLPIQVTGLFKGHCSAAYLSLPC